MAFDGFVDSLSFILLYYRITLLLPWIARVPLYFGIFKLTMLLRLGIS